MKIHHGYVRRLDLTSTQLAALDVQAHAARGLWNLLHEWWTWGGKRRPPTLKEADQAIRLARKEIHWLADLPASSAQQVLRSYFQAWKNCWEGRSEAPGFKARQRTRPAVDNPEASQFRLRRLSKRVGIVTVPKIGRVRFRWSGPIPGMGREPGRLTGARLVKHPIGWHIVFRAEIEKPTPAQHPGPAVGIDRGVNVALALSDGRDMTHDAWSRPGESQRLLRLERKSARQRSARKRGEPPSNRLRRTYRQIAKACARTKRRRLDWQHKTTTSIAERYGIVVVEDLRLTSMTRRPKGTVKSPGKNVRQKSGLNRALLNEAHGRTVDLLTYKLIERGGQLLKVPAAYTSRTCSACGHRDAASRVGIKFACTSCGWVGHADTNAAVNILNAAGLAVYGRGAGAVGPGSEASTTLHQNALAGNPSPQVAGEANQRRMLHHHRHGPQG